MEAFTKTSNQVELFKERNVITLPTKNQPYTISPKHPIDPVIWANSYVNLLNDLLLEYGAILMRGFDIGGAEKFNNLFSAVCGNPIEYKNRTSPRERVHENVYTSTSHPSDQNIYMHTENSYSEIYNRIISFYCLVPPIIGGETPIADERQLLASLKKETVEKFRKKGIRYVRNTFPGIGLDWKTIYQTDDKEKVNQKLKALDYDFVWVDQDHLKVNWNLPAFQKHPVTNQEMWFNHMYFGHKSLYNPGILEFFKEENLPFVTYYGDGTEIEKEIIEEIQKFYSENSIVFKWQKDDFLLLDNMMYSHGRKPFEGDRIILTAMGELQKSS
tara:strand:+ start:1403 stop:2389 length:987 start_codon:yes stop_codon:yes gene_type:complete